MKPSCRHTLAPFLLLGFVLVFIWAVALNTSCTSNHVDTALHLVMLENPKSLDPILSSDALAAEAIGPVYETLYQYDYLKRPYEIIPLLAETMPQVSPNGLSVTVKIKKGVLFQDDKCFEKGRGRELVAQDFIYGINRLTDPKSQSEGRWIFEGRLKTLEAPDPYTLVFKLTKKYPQLKYVLAMPYSAPMAHEAIEKYGADIVSHPVGTGAFVMAEYTRNSQIVYEKNPHFHGEKFQGQDLPLTDKIILHIMLEEQPSWLQFMRGRVDLIRLPKDNFSSAITEKHELKEELLKHSIHLTKNPSTTEWFIGFNMDDPVIGKNKLLRKAIGLAYDSKKDIQLFTNGLGTPSNQVLPPSIAGFDASISARESGVERAKDLLRRAGNPNGTGLPALIFDVEGSSKERQRGEFFKNEMQKVGINIQIRTNTRPELLDRKHKGKLQIHMDGWVADYPDAENFMQLLYGPNNPPGPNNSSFNNTEFNELYLKMADMPDSPERRKIISRMTSIFLEEAPWIPNWIATLYYLNQDWLKNYVYSDFSYNNYKYYRLDLARKKELLPTF